MLEIQSFNKNGIIVTTKGCSLFGRVSTIDYIYINYWARIEICSTHTRHSVELWDRLFLFKEHMCFVEYHSYFCTIKLHYANFGDGFKKFIIDLTKSLYIYNYIQSFRSSQIFIHGNVHSQILSPLLFRPFVVREVVSSSSVSTSSLTHGNLLIGIGEDGVGVGGIIVGCPTMPLNDKN